MSDETSLDEVERRLKILERSAPQRRPGYDPLRAELEKAVFPRFVAMLGPKGLPKGKDGLEELHAQAAGLVRGMAADLGKQPTPEDVDAVAETLVHDVTGTGPVHDLLDDPTVNEIMVNGPDLVLVERHGRIERTGIRFRDEQHLTHFIRKIAERLDRRIDFQSPALDGRLPTGQRVHAILPPLAIDGPVLTIRKYGALYQQMEDLISVGSLRPEMAYYLGACVKARMNVAIGGPSASGKTTTLNVLASQIPDEERLVTIEELAELNLAQAHGHVVRLQTRQDNVEGAGGWTIRQLVKESLRMRADRVVVGEARGAEMVDVLQAMRCGHDGSMTTIHASTSHDLIERAVTLALFGAVRLTEHSLRRQVVDALDVIVMMARFPDGTRRVVEISEPYRDETGEVQIHTVFKFEVEGYQGRNVLGAFHWVNPSRHADRLERMNLNLPEPKLGVLD